MSDSTRGDMAQTLSKRLTRRDVLQGAAVLGAAAAFAPTLSACGSGTGASPSPSGSGVPKKGGQLRAGIIGGSTKDTLDVHMGSLEMEIAIAYQLYRGLFEYTPDFKVTNALAEEATANPDATVWTVRLKKDVLYSDGKPVTADDVIFSVNRIIDPKDPKIGAGLLADVSPTGMKKLDDRTVEFTLKNPNSLFVEALAYHTNGIVRSDYDPKNPVGSETGPFTLNLNSYVAGQTAVFAPNKNWWGEGPYVDELTIMGISDATARTNALLGGTADMIDQCAGPQSQTIQAAGFKLWETKAGSWVPFNMRIDVKPFSDVRVRQAFRLIPDRQEMIDLALGGYGWMGNDMYAPYDPAYPKDFPQRQQDFEQAKSLLKQAGYSDLSVQLDTSTIVGSGGVEMATVFAEQAKGAGVNVKVNKISPDAFYGDNYLTYPFVTDGWGTRNYLLQTSLGTAPDAPYNATHWSNDKWYALVKEAYSTVDEAGRNELIRECQTIEYNEGGLIIYSFNTLVDAHSDKLGGLVHDIALNSAMGSRYHLVYFT